jgi:hypothetical protein
MQLLGTPMVMSNEAVRVLANVISALMVTVPV